MLSYKIYGVLSPQTDINLFKKALKVVEKGELWMTNEIIKVFLHREEFFSGRGKISGVTEREREVIKYICQGYKNKEIATTLCLSEQTTPIRLAANCTRPRKSVRHCRTFENGH